jgi:sugar phosphate isomerase/epimerase
MIMSRPITICSLQWGDLPLKDVCAHLKAFGYDGIELGLVGDHLDVAAAAESKTYCDDVKAILADKGLGCWAFAAHLQGQLVCDRYDERHNAYVPEAIRGDAAAMRAWAVKTMTDCARAARNMGVGTVTGFTGSPLWPYLYSFPPVSRAMMPAAEVLPLVSVKMALRWWSSTRRQSAASWAAEASLPDSSSTAMRMLRSKLSAK